MSALGQRFIDHHLRFRPVDGSFMGRRDCDARLPPCDRGVLDEESRAIAALQVEARQAPERTVGERLDKRAVLAELGLAARSNAERPRFSNPAWYSGEATFALVSLLLPQSLPLDVPALHARLTALPDFLSDARARLTDIGAAPAGWRERALRESQALAHFLMHEFLALPAVSADGRAPAQRAADALTDFAGSLATLADRDPAAGAGYVQQVMREVHALGDHAGSALADARAAFERLGAELVEDAARLAPGLTWQQAIAGLATATPPLGAVLPAYRHWDQRARDAVTTADLVTPASEYALDYRELDAAFCGLAAETYFLYYRSPPALRPGNGSVYWVTPPSADSQAYLRGQHHHAVLKTTHAVHHGSIGHHTQNARARQAPGLLGRLAGTDCASGVALLSSGTMVEGWACYAEDLLREAGDFYAGAELLLLKQNERRNAASVLVDIHLHRGEWSLAEAERFYRDEAGFPAQRVHSEVVRNSMFPGSRLMYWIGVEQIKALRRASPHPARRFHDQLLSFGHAPIAAVADEIARADRDT